jgi:hypothetical protein
MLMEAIETVEAPMTDNEVMVLQATVVTVGVAFLIIAGVSLC